MVQIFPFQVDLGTAQIVCHLGSIVQTGRPPGVLLLQRLQLGPELRIVLVAVLGLLQFQNRVHQRFRNILTAVRAKTSF